MAWRLSNLTTYIAGSNPVIKAFDLNALQTAIVDLFLGNYTLKKVTADGTGDASAASTTAGDIKASGSLIGKQLVGVGTAPTGVVSPSGGYNLGTGGGVGVGITGHSLAHLVTLTVGSSGSSGTGGRLAVITLNATYGGTYAVSLTASNLQTATTFGGTIFAKYISATSYEIWAYAGTIANGDVYGWNVHLIGTF